MLDIKLEKSMLKPAMIKNLLKAIEAKKEDEVEVPLLLEISLLLKTFVAFRCDICFNGKLQVPEKFYIGSEEGKDKSDEQVLIIILFITSLLS